MDFFLSERKESSYVMLLDKIWLILSFDKLNNITIVTGVTLLSVLDVLLLSSYWHNSVKKSIYEKLGRSPNSVENM